jgi:hypothetical protein
MKNPEFKSSDVYTPSHHVSKQRTKHLPHCFL